MDERRRQLRTATAWLLLAPLAIGIAAAALVALPVVGALLCVAVFVLGVASGYALRSERRNEATCQKAEPERRPMEAGWSQPPARETIGPFEIACHADFYEGCGGDWWSIRQLDHGCVLLVIGDVTGHGLPAALVAAQARGAVAALEEEVGSPITPSRVLSTVHRVVSSVGEGKLFTTCFAMVLDPANGVVDYANASHCFPYVLSPKEGKGLEIMVARGNPLGDGELCIATGRRELCPGDLFVLHTDGLADALSARAGRCGNAQLRAVLREQHRPAEGPDPLSLRDALRARLGSDGVAAGGPEMDDITLIACQFAAEGYEQSRAKTSRCRVVETAPGRFAVLEEQVGKAPVSPKVVQPRQQSAGQEQAFGENVERPKSLNVAQKDEPEEPESADREDSTRMPAPRLASA